MIEILITKPDFIPPILKMECPSKPQVPFNLVLKAVKTYSEWLKYRPILTKSVTSGIMAVIGNILSQLIKMLQATKIIRASSSSSKSSSTPDSSIENISEGSSESSDAENEKPIKSPDANSIPFRPRSCLTFGLMGFLVIGPLTHVLFNILEDLVPRPRDVYSRVGKVAIERICFAPILSLANVFAIDIFEGNLDVEKTTAKFLPVLKANWRFWTIPMLINVNFVPVEFRVLFSNCVALLWNIYLARIAA